MAIQLQVYNARGVNNYRSVSFNGDLVELPLQIGDMLLMQQYCLHTSVLNL